MEVENVDIGNHQCVGLFTDKVLILRAKTMMTPEEALVQAAWLVAITDRSEDFKDFKAILKRVLNT